MATEEDARRSLSELADVRRAAHDRRANPPWYLHAVGGAILALALAQLLPTVASIVVSLLVALGIGALLGARQEKTGARVSLAQPAVARGAAPLTLALLALFVAGAVLGGAHPWLWVAIGVVGYTGVLVLGRRAEHRAAASVAG